MLNDVLTLGRTSGGGVGGGGVERDGCHRPHGFFYNILYLIFLGNRERSLFLSQFTLGIPRKNSINLHTKQLMSTMAPRLLLHPILNNEHH